MGEPNDEQRVAHDPFDGADRDVTITGRRVRMVTTQRMHLCACCGEVKRAGSRMRFESAIVDGEPGSYYACIPCVDESIAAEAEGRAPDLTASLIGVTGG